MPLSWNEIRDRAIAFSKEWEGEESERAEAQSFWNDFFNVFGISRKRVAVFEKQVDLSRAKRKLKGGRIDAFWKGVLLIEHKSAGSDLDRAFGQATDYFDGIAERDLPNYILVSDFARFRLYDLEADQHWEFRLKDLHKHVKRFGFIAGYAPQEIKPQDPVNIKAAEQMGRLHDLLKASGYTGHDLEVLLVRLVFCLFADDTGIFPKQSFRDWLEQRTAEDGSDLGPQLALLFQVLNTPKEKRQKNLDEQLAEFAYVNGKLFEEVLQVASFDSRMRATLLDCCKLNWGAVSPAIFGALFQSIMDEKARRNLGAHYTSEENILKLIKPLFLDDLWDEFNRVKGNKNRLFDFHKKLHALTFLDPACGCGNFLVITYRELRLLELEILRAARKDERSAMLLSLHSYLTIDVDQFYGVEIEDFPAQIAQVALWLIDHQMNQIVSQEFGVYFARIPLTTSPHIVRDNALRLDWNTVIPAERLSYILGNPPFVGHQWRTQPQMDDMSHIWGDEGRFGRLDYVSCWYRKAVDYVVEAPAIRVAFVSTNSISQGEQVGTLWGYLLSRGVVIHFAHRPFQWTNEARDVAGVHCVIIGFALKDRPEKKLFDYASPKAEPHVSVVANINPYLVAGPNVVLPSRTDPPVGIPQMKKGSQPTDGGNLILSKEQLKDLLAGEPAAKKWIRPFVGGDELISGDYRYCLWLKDAQPEQLRSMPNVLARVEAVRHARLKSPTKSVREFARFPTLFTQDRQPTQAYLAIPEVSSENRRIIPMDFLPPEVIASNKLQIVVGATHYHLGVLQSAMHMAWVRVVSGRLESRYSYAPAVYNNFPWPTNPSKSHVEKIEKATKEVLDTRKTFRGSSFADLYDPIAMPPSLTKAHHALDAAVDSAYGRKSFESDASRVAFLFELYQKDTSLLPSAESPKVKRSRRPRAH
jgi:hypothetical protein